MQLSAEIKYDNYQELPRQQEVQYAHSTTNYLQADTSSGKHYYDLNAAGKSYRGPWLFGKQAITINANGMRGQWIQWCPIPADIRDGILLRGNVIYQSPTGASRMSQDVYEGMIESENGYEGNRFFVGRTQHTFYARNFPGGQLQVVANVKIHLDQRLAYNPMLGPSQTASPTSGYSSQESNAAEIVPAPEGTQTTIEGAQGDSGF
jgi:hypothetical protein